jgi:hypothetical protein
VAGGGGVAQLEVAETQERRGEAKDDGGVLHFYVAIVERISLHHLLSDHQRGCPGSWHSQSNHSLTT